MNNFRTIQTPESRCPHCKYLLDACASLSMDSPDEGDISICISCGGLLQMRKDWTVKELEPSAAFQLAIEDPRVYRRLMEAQAAILAINKKRAKNRRSKKSN